MFERMPWAVKQHAHRPLKVLPVVACVPGTDVWFLRFALAFLSHLQHGGHIVDRLDGQCIGNPAGPSFNFDHMSGGPLLWVPDLLPSRHLFIGHTVCPGFNRISSEFDWWASTPFSAPGYDYLHDGVNYAHVQVDLAPHAFAAVSVSDVEAAAWTHAGQRMVLVYDDPIEQAVFSFNQRRSPGRRDHARSGERRTGDHPFHDYLFRQALPGYAKMMVSYQAMAKAVPGAVQIISEDVLRAEPERTLSSILSHLSLDRWRSSLIDAAVHLARREHIEAIEREIGRSLISSRRRRGTSIASEAAAAAAGDAGLRREALTLLASMGVNIAYFQTLPSRSDAATTGSARAR